MIRDYMVQVEPIARQDAAAKQAMEPAMGVIFFVDVIWLVWAGRIKNDNYNGTQFVWEAK